MLHDSKCDTDEESFPNAGFEQLLERIALALERFLDIENFLLGSFFSMNLNQNWQRFIRPVPLDEPSRAFGNEQHQDHEQQSRNGPDTEHPTPRGGYVPSVVTHADNP
ncbi:hypothetical protein D3C71_1232730 [compost metagenome]